jgi:Fur family transcriptional regulator, iron response regulator
LFLREFDRSAAAPYNLPMLSIELKREDVAQRLHEHGISPTHQRVEIAHALFSRQQHLSADQLFAMVNEHKFESSKATVYNTLNLLVEKGLVREVVVDASRTFYDPNTSPHFHLYDVGTGQLSDIDAHDVRIAGLPPLPQGMQFEGLDLIVRARSSVSSE